MKRHVFVWALIGLLVATCWVIAAFALGTGSNLGHWTIVSITAPAAFFGQRFPLAFYWSVLLNAAIYASVGLGAELLLLRFRR